jgi:CarD family transcriptional regulator
MEFKVGEKVVYPHHGVGEVTAVESKDIAGRPKHFYILRIVENGMKVMVPTEGAARCGLRAVISNSEAEKVLDSLKAPTKKVAPTPWVRRQREYADMLKSGSPFEVAKVLRDLTRLGTSKELSFGEQRVLERARALLVTELALARRCQEEHMRAEITSVLAN